MAVNDELRETALAIFRAGLAAVEAGRAVREALALDGARLSFPGRGDTPLDLDRFQRIVVVGGGKAGAPMAAALEGILGDRIEDGLVVVKDGHAGTPIRRVRVAEAGHPVPDERGRAAAAEIARILDGLGEKDLALVLLSGGASALLPLPAEGIALEDKIALTGILLASGADIRAVNAVRKHLSALKGGGLARRARPATVVSLILSDVMGDPLDAIASGPTAPDPTTFAGARDALVCHGVWEPAPRTLRERIEAGCAGRIPETPKPGDPAFEHCLNVIVASNRTFLEACLAQARSRGLNARILSASVEGEARMVGADYAALARRIVETGLPVPPPACLLAGGETTVRITGTGKGGRNQELALSAAMGLTGLPGAAVMAAGTDGTDGPTDAAGAIAFGDTLERARALGLNPRALLDNNDSHGFFSPLNDLIVTGPTGTNVMDAHLILVR